MRCARHPQAETYVRCSKCDTPVCGECMVTGPVGIRCRQCSRPNESPLFKPQPTSLARAGLFGAATAGLFGILMKLFVFVGPAAVGYLIGEMVLRGGGRKRGGLMEVVAGACALLGALYTVPWFLVLTRGLFAFLSPSMWYALAAAVIAIACAVGRVRYL